MDSALGCTARKMNTQTMMMLNVTDVIRLVLPAYIRRMRTVLIVISDTSLIHRQKNAYHAAK